MTKKIFPMIVCNSIKILTIIGLFCVLAGCEAITRDASETRENIISPKNDNTQENTTDIPYTAVNPLPKIEFEESDTETSHEIDTEESNSTEYNSKESESIDIPDENPPSPDSKEGDIINFENTPSQAAQHWIDYYNSFSDADTVILDSDGICRLNDKISAECPTMHDMTAISETMSGAEVSDLIKKGLPPASQKHDRHGNPIYKEHIDKIENNKNLAAIADTVYVKLGMVTNRTNIRTVPSEKNFFDETDYQKFYDRIQESELIIGTPVWILHESLDGQFYFIQSYYYSGWVNKSDIAEASAKDYLRFALCRKTGESIVCITAAAEYIDDLRLDMGAVFPFVSGTEDMLSFELPCRDENGILYSKTTWISKNSASYGYLPYTMGGFYTQAFKYEGTMYGWGGADNGVDCSGFVCAVFRSFGIYLPRNTGEQKNFGGTVTDLSGADAQTVKNSLKKLTLPSSIHRKGHVMLYLGTIDEKVYIIHAPQGGMQVCQTELSKLDNLICAVTMN